MSSIDYKQKYLKYKNKYLELKALDDSSKLNNQTGGFAYAPGEYVFFIPANKADFDSQTPKDFSQKKMVDENGNILGMTGLDDLTNYLGTCTKFIRVGKTTTGFDLANTYNTLYANQSTGSVVKREVNDAKTAAQPYIDSAIDTGKKFGQKIGDVFTQNNEQKLDQSKPVINLNESTIHSSDLSISSDEEKPVINNNSIPIPLSTDVKVGGDGECVKIPEKLSKELLIGTQNDITEAKLLDIVKFIKDKGLQGTNLENQISRIIYVKKPLVPGKPTSIDMARNFVVNYDQNNNVVSVSKK